MDSTSTRRNVSMQKNPLELTPVIKCVLKYLNVTDLKNCRYISKEWSSTALVELKTRAKIVFRRRVCSEDNDSDRTPARFYEDFSNNLSIPFTAFEFEANWKLTELNSFVHSHKNILHEFYLNTVDLYDDKNQIIKSFDISPLISDSPMTTSDTKRSTKLSVIQSYLETQIVVSISTLVHVKKIELKCNCQLILDGKVKPRPIELKLRNVEFVRNGDKVTDVYLNDIFDFSSFKKFQIFGMKLDLSLNNALALDYLDLQNCIIKNWRACNWSVKKLVLHKVPFIENNEMQIKELAFCGSRTNLSLLPKSLKTLSVNVSIVCRENDFFASQLVSLPNLKSLCLNVKEHLPEMISHFVQSPLVALDLCFADQSLSPLEINFNAIPKSVKKLKLRHVTVNFQDGDSPLNLDKLVLQEYSFHGNPARDLTSSYFKTTELIIVGKPTGIVQVIGDALELLLYDKKCLDCNQRFYIGPFNWRRRLFDNSPLIQYVDTKAEYYVFENGMGKSVTRHQFGDLGNVYTYSE